ncbi:HNH endonuclease [Sphingobium rhizovicinum]|uniref:HNH endonuclease n=1 Tax=Sphingobium rhizovicinum TaxID=432308 RepID=A0ABV7NKN2_9SPHN
MSRPELHTIGDRIAWSYANLASVHSALAAGRTKRGTTDWMIRARLFSGLRDGVMQIGSLFDDERLQLMDAPTCVYCGSDESLSVDHLIPRAMGGSHAQHNLVRACRSCNSSKGKRDLLAWFESRQTSPPIMLLRRYLKLVALFCDENGLLDQTAGNMEHLDLPFEFARLPETFPPLTDLRL